VIISEDYLPRAMAAWYRGGKTGESRLYPSEAMSIQVTLPDGKSYVLLANSYSVLGVYRIRPNGVLKLLRRWPNTHGGELCIIFLTTPCGEHVNTGFANACPVEMMQD
jgi:hypothetical protein